MEKRKSATVFIVLIAVLCLTATLFAACNKSDELPSSSPVTWEDHLEEAAGRIAEHIAMNEGKVSIVFSVEAAVDDGNYSLLFGLNYDLTAKENCCLVIEVTDADALSEAAESAAEEGLIFSLVCDDATSWIDIAPGLALADARMKIENLNLFDLLGAVYNEQNEEAGIEAFADIVYNLGRAFFGGVRVSGDGNTYHFAVNENYKEEGESYFAAVTDVFGKEVSSALLAAFGIEDAAELFSMMPAMRGEVTLSFSEEGIAFSSEGLVIDGGVSGISAKFETSYQLSDVLAAKVPDGTEVGYITTKIGNAHMSGKVQLLSGGGTPVSYDYVLDANLDLLKLALNGYDLTSLDEDNYFHLRVTHTCTATCGEFCESRYAAARGAVLDIAFSPADFGSYNVYFSIALQALMPKERAEWLNSEMRTLFTSNLLPEYTLITYPYQLFDASSPVCEMLTVLYADNMFATGSIDVPVDMSDPVLSAVSALMGEDWLGGTTSIRIDINENVFGMAQPHDIYSETVFIIDSGIGDVKDYALHIASLALSWEWEQPATVAATGEKLTGIYAENGTMLHGVDGDGGYVPMSREEITGMLGEYYIRATRVNLDGTVAKTPYYARVIDIDDADLESNDVQTVTFTVEYPNPVSALGIADYSDGAASMFSMQVSANIKLTDRTTAEVVFAPHVDVGTELEIVHADSVSGGTYYGLRSSIPEFLYADAEVEYVNGDKKSTTIVGRTEAVGTRDAIINTYYYSTMCGEITVHWEFLDGEEDGKYFVTPPDRIEYDIDAASMPSHSVGETVYMATITNHVTATAYYDYDDGTHKAIRANLTAENIFINGIPLSTSSTYWRSERMLLGGYKVTFNVANKYECRIEVFNKRSDTFFLNVEAYLGDDATYRFEQTSTDPVFWFAGRDYEFEGRIVNATHGINSDPVRRLTVSVIKNYDGTYGNRPIDISTSECAVWLSEFEADAPFTAGETGVMTSESFPALIVTGIDISFKLRFNEPGYYRVRLQLEGYGGFTKYWYIAVADADATNVLP